MKFTRERFWSLFTDHKQRAVLAVSGLALLGGLATPATAAHTDPHPPATQTAVQLVAKADKTDKAPTAEQLMPGGVPAGQQAFTPDAEQIANAKAIVEAGKAMKLPPRAWTIAVATSLQESKLHNLGHLGDANDHDSLGLFQQRPTSGWGTPEQITDPTYSASAFYKGLAQVPGYEKMPLTDAAQRVQVSAYPDAYAKWEKMSADIVQGVHGHGPYADKAKH